MNQEKEIIEFEDLFKTDRPQQKPNVERPDQKKKYIQSIFAYLLVMLLGASFLILLLGNVRALQKTYTENELILENIAYDVNGIAILDEAQYLEIHAPYDDFVVNVDTYLGYVILVNSGNTYYDSVLLMTDELSGDIILNIDAITGIFTDVSITTWDNDSLEINIYAGKSQVLPLFFAADYYEVEGPITDFSDFGTSLLNFLVYLMLLPIIFILLKIDFVGDFNDFKVKKDQWLPIIAIGYVYILLGNVISNYASGFLGDLLGLAPAEAINQMVIIRALNSSGVIFMVLSAVVMGPIVEELVFRKSIFGLIKSDKIALIVSAILFGSIHLVGEVSIVAALINGISYFVMGFVFGYIYLKNNKNIIAPMAVHILSNLISIVALLFFY